MNVQENMLTDIKGGEKMSEEIEFYEALAKLRDWLFQGADLAETIDLAIQKKTKVVTSDYAIDQINWEQKSGDKGPYELANDKGNVGNVNYEGLKADLKAHGKPMIKQGQFIWLFQDGTAIGKKTSKR